MKINGKYPKKCPNRKGGTWCRTFKIKCRPVECSHSGKGVTKSIANMFRFALYSAMSFEEAIGKSLSRNPQKKKKVKRKTMKRPRMVLTP